MSGLTTPVSESDHRSGPDDASVTLVEYGDFECPACGAAYPIVEGVRKRMGARLRFVFRHFPLTQMHPHAMHAAEAAEAAGAQGKFWQMHGMLFEHQNALEDADLVRYAKALHLDVKRFASELASGAHAERIREHIRSGIRSGVNGTPTFFINGVRHDGSWDAPVLLAALETAAAA
jgi:protein-disulfide isomerase